MSRWLLPMRTVRWGAGWAASALGGEKILTSICCGVSTKHCVILCCLVGQTVWLWFSPFSVIAKSGQRDRLVTLLSQRSILILEKVTQLQCCDSDHLLVLGFHIPQWLKACSLVFSIFSRKHLNPGFLLPRGITAEKTGTTGTLLAIF